MSIAPDGIANRITCVGQFFRGWSTSASSISQWMVILLAVVKGDHRGPLAVETQ